MLAACSSPSPHRQLAVPQPPAAPAAAPAPDAALPPVLGSRGDACRPDSCGEGLTCGALLGGYCTSVCGFTGSPCDGTCVETAHAGELCMKTCASDRDCRTEEGYLCDATWHACLLPNVAAIEPHRCPTLNPARDTSFGDSEPWSTGAAPGVYQFEPATVLTDDGGLVALYATRDRPANGNVLGVARVDGKGARTIDVPFTTDRTNHFDPWLARGRTGTLYAVWLGYDVGGQREIGLATSTDRGARWSTPVAVHDPSDCTEDASGCLEKPMIVVGIDPVTRGEIIYVMYAAGSHGLRVRASRDGGKTFGPGAIALAGTYGNAVATADGRLHVVALAGSPLGAYGSAQQVVEYTVSSDGGATFSRPVVVSARDEMLPYFFANPSLAIDTRRKWLYAAYVRGGRDARWDIMLAVSKDGGATWRRTKLAGDDCAIHMVPNLALDPTTGTLHVAYYDSEDAPGRFVHASCGPGATRCKILGAINSTPFATLSTTRHSTKWVGEYEGLVVDDKRRVLHAVWAQTVDEARQPITRIFHAQAKLNK